MATPSSTAYCLNYSRRHLKDNFLPNLRRELPTGKASYTYEEVDFSQNELSSGGLTHVLEVCRRCPKLRILKLYKNQIDDGGAEGLAELCKLIPGIEEIHLSHNHFTERGVEVLVTAAEESRPAHLSPLWLRLEHNDVSNPETVFNDLQSRLSVCMRVNEVRCTVRVCCMKRKVHLPFFNLQRETRRGPPGANPGVRSLPGANPGVRSLPGANPGVRSSPQAKSPAVFNPAQSVMPKQGPAGPKNPPACPTANSTPKSATPTPGGASAWDVNGANAARRFNEQTAAAPGTGTARPPPPPPKASAGGGYPEASPASTGARGAASGGAAPLAPAATAGDSGPVEEVPEASPSPALQQKASQEEFEPTLHKTGQSRGSMVLDSQGRRRILPKQMEAEGSNVQFVCPLCAFVIIKPVITSCSHIFCDACFRKWVGDQVSKQKKGMPGEGPVPLIQCPQPQCMSKLRKKDIIPMDQVDGTKVGFEVLRRMRNNLQIRCVHHVQHYKYPFGQDSKRVNSETGMTCTWAGDLRAYEEHIRGGCCIERYLEGTLADGGDKENGQSPAASPTPASHSQGGSATAGAKATAPSKPADHSTATVPAGAEVDREEESAAVEEPPPDTRVARYDYKPQEADKAQIPLTQNDLVKIFEVTEAGWAAGVRLCRKTGQELGTVGWFPATYLYPPGHADAAATA